MRNLARPMEESSSQFSFGRKNLRLIGIYTVHITRCRLLDSLKYLIDEVFIYFIEIALGFIVGAHAFVYLPFGAAQIGHMV